MNVSRRRLWLSGVGAVGVFGLGAGLLLTPKVWAQAFDHSHAAWSALLKKHVVLLRAGQASQVRYAGFMTDRQILGRYLETLSSVSQEAFTAFNPAQQQAFLINAYNAFTVELILTKYPQIKSIKDVGGLFGNPWKPKWINLLGSRVSLDDIEHEMLRKRGRYDEPRVHFAVNCASVGCPMLREEAYVDRKLEQQLAEQAQRFMADRTRNRFNAQRNRLEVSKIFDWYGQDFKQGFRGISSLAGFAARYADQLADQPADRELIRGQKFEINFLDYDWSLNDAG